MELKNWVDVKMAESLYCEKWAMVIKCCGNV